MRRGFMGVAAALAVIFGMGYSATPPREPKRPLKMGWSGLSGCGGDADRIAAAQIKRQRKLARNARLGGF